MAFTQVGGQVKYRPYDKCSVGEVVAEGRLMSVEPANFGDAYFIQEEGGQTVGVNSCGLLNYRYKVKGSIQIGDFIRIVYQGMDALKDGKFKGKKSHNVDIFIDPERSRPRPGLPGYSGNVGAIEKTEDRKQAAASLPDGELDL